VFLPARFWPFSRMGFILQLVVGFAGGLIPAAVEVDAGLLG
jgi:hypothetical protein